ncbi:MAG: aspartate/glutamate racemase family protein [Candidatus Geothermincolia bacterium]
MEHIGIAACSSEGAALCYRTICNDASALLGRYRHPEITMHTHPFSTYMDFIEAGDWDGVAGLMIASAEILALAGADFVICPDNTIHQAFDLVEKRSPVPWLNIACGVALEAGRLEFRRLGIMGTKFLMEGPVYPDQLSPLGIEYIIPGPAARERINDVIFNELVAGNCSGESLTYLLEVINGLRSEGCDAVVLGCTELPLVITPEKSALPTLDSTRLLARMALNRSLGKCI